VEEDGERGGGENLLFAHRCLVLVQIECVGEALGHGPALPMFRSGGGGRSQKGGQSYARAVMDLDWLASMNVFVTF